MGEDNDKISFDSMLETSLADAQVGTGEEESPQARPPGDASAAQETTQVETIRLRRPDGQEIEVPVDAAWDVPHRDQRYSFSIRDILDDLAPKGLDVGNTKKKLDAEREAIKAKYGGENLERIDLFLSWTERLLEDPAEYRAVLDIMNGKRRASDHAKPTPRAQEPREVPSQNGHGLDLDDPDGPETGRDVTTPTRTQSTSLPPEVLAIITRQGQAMEAMQKALLELQGREKERVAERERAEQTRQITDFETDLQAQIRASKVLSDLGEDQAQSLVIGHMLANKVQDPRIGVREAEKFARNMLEKAGAKRVDEKVASRDVYRTEAPDAPPAPVAAPRRGPMPQNPLFEQGGKWFEDSLEEMRVNQDAFDQAQRQ